MRSRAEAVIVAGGRGTRLAPYTTVLPKPLMPVGDRPILDIVISQLQAAGVGRLTISVGHLGGLIESWVTNGANYELPIDFLYEDEPLGTAGALGNIRPTGTVIAMNGDILTTLAVDDLIARHKSDGSLATVATNLRELPIDYGVVKTEQVGAVAKIVGLEEKPVHKVEVSMGIYTFEPAALEYIEPGERVDFPDLLQRMMDDGQTVGTYRFDGYWRDIGNSADYVQATEDFEADPGQFIGS